MEFLYKLYSNDYFGIGLFIVITILAFSFLIILFFGKKDEQARNKINNNKENKLETKDNSSLEELKTESLETMNLSLEENQDSELLEENNSYEEETVIDPFVSSNMVLNTDLVNEEEEKEEIIEVEDITEPSLKDIFNVTSLENSTDFDIPSEIIEEEKNDESNTETLRAETPVIEEPVQNDIFSEPKEVVPKKVVMPTQFSSVYLTKDKEEQKQEIVEEKQEEVAPIPLKPDFDLPKPFDLPKLNKDSGVTSAANDNIIKPLINDNNDNLSNIFKNIEEDTYTINK